MRAFLDAVGQDLRYAIRALSADRRFAAITVLSLALGIGANSAIFSILDALVLKTLPVKQPQRLVQILPGRGQSSFNTALWEQLRQRLPRDVLSDALAWSTARFNIAPAGESRYVTGLLASGEYFSALGAPAILGRVFSVADDQRGGGKDGPVAVISYGFWRRHYAGDAAVLGRTLKLDGQAFEIIGVTPPSFFGAEVGRSFDVAVPLGAEPLLRGETSMLDSPGAWWLSVMARLTDGTTPERAASRLSVLVPAILEATRPEARPPDALRAGLGDRFEIQSASGGLSALRARYERVIWLLVAVVAVVLLISCANVANLLLARAVVRRREFAVRMALGAGSRRLLGQLLSESLLLALLGGALGVLLAHWGSRALAGFLDLALDVGIDGRVMGFTGAVALLAALLFGLAPAFLARGVAPNSALKQGSGGSLTGASRQWLGKSLVVAQVGLSLVLLVGAGLLLRTLRNLVTLDAGFETDNVLLINLDVQSAGYPPAQRSEVYKRVLHRLRAIAGVRSASQAVNTPVGGGTWLMRTEVPGYTPRSRAEGLVAYNRVSEQFFATLGTPLRSGRDFTARDTAGSPAVAIVNETLARRFSGDALGQSLLLPRPGGGTWPVEVIGIVKDAKHRSLRIEAPPAAYLAMSQETRPRTSAEFQVKASRLAPGLVPAVRDAILAVDENVSMSFRTFAAQVNDSLAQERLVATLCGCFALLALLLTVIGLHGLISYGVARRSREIGIRVALGADRRSILWLVLSEVILMTAIGTLLGLIASQALSRLVDRLLYGVAANDALTTAVAVAALGALAGYLPARRAAAQHPLAALRNE